MFELLTIIIFIWLLVKAIGLAFKLTWGVAKIAASILIGLDDPSFLADYLFGDAASVSASTLGELQNEVDRYTILLAHRPELFDVYVKFGIDLVFSGHAHGGQFRLPFVGGLVARNQGFFPKYDAGLYNEEHTTMIVSRGVGNSILPVRFNNRPEIIVAELKPLA